MPDDRFFHKKLGHSEKVCSLTDFEFRVWSQYELSADDYGVMRFAAAPLQADNDALDKRPAKQVQRAFEVVVEVGLLFLFEHQGRPYVYQFDWQDWQKIRHPRAAIHPCPPTIALARCTPDTVDLFRSHPGCPPEVLSEDFGSFSGVSLTPARACGRERLTATGSKVSASGFGNARERFERFWTSYPRKVGKEAAWKEWDRIRPKADDTFTDAAIAAVEAQKRSSQWQKDDGQFIPHPRTWLHQGRWQDELDSQKDSEPADVDWFEECQQIHAGACEGDRMRHHLRKQTDAQKAGVA